jgi:D-galactarolactone cycloisomerase
LLEGHRLIRIDSQRVQDRFPRYVGRNATGKPQAYGAGTQFRVLTTDQGAQGWGTSHLPEEQLQPLLSRRIADLIDPAAGVFEHARGLDQPLHDLAGRILGMPVYRMLGASGSRQVPIYSGAVYFDDLEPEDAPRGVPGVIASCRQDYEAGYRAFKLKIGRGKKWMEPDVGRQRDIAVVRAVREAFPDCKILVDANNAYNCETFLDFVEAVADCDLYWIEEPFPENEADLRRLKESMARVGCRALIAEGEHRTEAADPPGRYGGYTMRHIDHLYDLAAKGLVDVFIIDLNIVGFSRWRTVMPELIEANVPVSPHTWCWCVRPRYVAQIAAGLGNVVCIEGIPGTTSGVDYTNYPIRDGEMSVPELPGFAIPLEL